MKQTALYFNPKLDTVHIKKDEFRTLAGTSYSIHWKTTQSIRTLAIGSQDVRMKYVARQLRAFRMLEMLILVIDGEMADDGEGSSLPENMEDYLVKVKDQLVLQGKCKAWKLPLVKVMDAQAFENDL
jgi:hypothetical protein